MARWPLKTGGPDAARPPRGRGPGATWAGAVSSGPFLAHHGAGNTVNLDSDPGYPPVATSSAPLPLASVSAASIGLSGVMSFADAMSRVHKNLKNEIRLALGQRSDIVLWNNESGVAFHQGGSVVRYGLGKGGADLIGVVRSMYAINGEATPVGRFIALEVKTGKATADADQKRFLELVRKMGGYAKVVRSVEDAVQAVEECKRGKHGDES